MKPTCKPYLFLVPFFILFGIFTVYPLFQSVTLALQQTHGPSHAVWVGLANFAYLFGDAKFWLAVRNTFIFVVFSVGLFIPVSLAVAILLNQPWLKGRAVFRLIIFSPSLVGVAFVAVIFRILFEKRVGLVNELLNALFNFDPDFPWLDHYVLPAIIICAMWMAIGHLMVYFLAALQAVSQDLLDAAAIDGANAWQKFVHVTLPEIMPILGFLALTTTIGSLQIFELSFLLNGGGAGPGDQGLTIVMYLYQNGFEIGDLGYASAIGWVLAIMLMMVATANRYYFGKREQH